MADDTRRAPGPADGAGRRQPPTIDLTAQEIRPETAADTPDTAPIYSKHDRVTDTPTRDFLSGARERKPGDDDAARKSSRLSLLFAGIAGGAIVAVTLFMMWLSGAVPIRYAGTTAMRARVGLLEMQLQEIKNRSSAAADKTLDEIGTRLTKIEQSIGKSPAPVDDGRLAMLEGNVRTLGVAIAGLSQRADEIAAGAVAARERATDARQSAAEARAAVERLPANASREDVDRLAARIAALESASSSSRDNAASHAALGTAVKFALAALALRDTVASGAPFAADLAAVKTHGGDAKVMAVLEPFASSGVPNDFVLARELLSLVPAIMTAAGVKEKAAGGFFDRLSANAEKLVKIRPVGEKSGDDAPATVARIEALAAGGQATLARAEIAKLPPSTRTVTQPWTNKLDARNAAVTAAATIATDAVRTLAQP